MTREEQIISEAKKYYSDNIKCFDAFVHGTEFADNNPDTLSFWHNASDEPVKDTHILIENSFFEDDLDYYSCHWSTSICPSWEEYVKEYYIKRWAYISDLLPKGDEQ